MENDSVAERTEAEAQPAVVGRNCTTHTQSLSLSLSLTHTHSLSLSLTHTHTHTHSLSLYQQKGRRPVMFGRKMNRPQEQQQLKQEVLDADLDIFAFQSSFDQNFHKAIRVGLHCSPSYDTFSCGYFLLRAIVYPCYIFTASKDWTGKQHRSTKNRSDLAFHPIFIVFRRLAVV